MADQPRRTAAEDASEAESETETAATNEAEDESATVATTAAAAVTVTGSEAMHEANHRAAMNGRRSTRKMRWYILADHHNSRLRPGSSTEVSARQPTSTR